MSNNIVLEIDGLYQAYSRGWFQRKEVLKDFTLQLEGGKIYALLGRNGAGKTTLLNCILGLLNYRPGEIRFKGESITRSNEHAMLQKITSVPAMSEMFLKLTGNAYMDAWRHLYDKWDDKLEERIRSLSDFDWNTRLRELSSGQKMQVLQAMALCPCPELLILDEPLGVTDPVVRKYFYKNVIDVVASRNTTVIIATHLITEVANLFDEALFLKNGELVHKGTMEDMTQSYVKFSVEPLPDWITAGERGRLLADDAILSEDASATRSDLKARGLNFSESSPNIEDLFEIFA